MSSRHAPTPRHLVLAAVLLLPALAACAGDPPTAPGPAVAAPVRQLADTTTASPSGTVSTAGNYENPNVKK